ncbi:MAG: hypothetical protein ACRC17_06345 [Culicoidibacterales bacterium]
MKFYGIKINGKYLEEIKMGQENNELTMISTDKVFDAHASESKEKTLKVAVTLIQELPELDIEMFEFEIKENILEV